MLKQNTVQACIQPDGHQVQPRMLIFRICQSNVGEMMSSRQIFEILSTNGAFKGTVCSFIDGSIFLFIKLTDKKDDRWNSKKITDLGKDVLGLEDPIIHSSWKTKNLLSSLALMTKGKK